MRYAHNIPGDHDPMRQPGGRRKRDEYDGGRGSRGHGHEAYDDFGDHDGHRGGRGRGRGRGPGARRGGFGGPGFGGPGFGPGGFGPGGPGFGPGGPGFGPGKGFGPGGPRGPRGRRARRGDVRGAVLSLLSEAPANGYGLMKGIEERTEGVWRVSPGSMYPTLAQLTDEGLIEPTENSGGSGTEYRLTEAGGTYVTEHTEELERVWKPADEQWAEVGDLMVAGRKLLAAVQQVGVSGTADQRTKAGEVLDRARREIYRMLGEE